MILEAMIKQKYVEPACKVQEARPLSYILMGSNEGYEVDPFEPFND